MPHGRNKKGYDTNYHYNMKRAFGRMVGFNKDEPYALAPLIKYMLLHGAAATLGCAVSYLFFHSFFVHTVWMLILFCSCLWNGSLRYYKMMTSYYEKMI